MIRWIVGGAIGGAVLLIICVLFIFPAFLSRNQPFVRVNNFVYYEVRLVSDDPLFTIDGHVNAHVRDALLEILSHSLLSDGHQSVTASNFSGFVVPNPINMSHSGAVVIQLFEAVPGMNGLAGAWWQLVYRSVDEDHDVITLWMTEPYRHVRFGGNRYESITRDMMNDIPQLLTMCCNGNI